LSFEKARSRSPGGLGGARVEDVCGGGGGGVSVEAEVDAAGGSFAGSAARRDVTSLRVFVTLREFMKHGVTPRPVAFV
jgi:hypothetical protein